MGAYEVNCKARLYLNEKFLGSLDADAETVRRLLEDRESRVKACLLNEVETVRAGIRWMLSAAPQENLQTIVVQSEPRHYGTLPVYIKFRLRPIPGEERRTEVVKCNFFLSGHKILSGP